MTTRSNQIAPANRRHTSRSKSARRVGLSHPSHARAPRGLVHLLALIDEGNFDDSIYACAEQLVASEARRNRTGLLGEMTADALTLAVYPGLGHPPFDDDTYLQAGVMLGAAMAWILMTDLQGGAR